MVVYETTRIMGRTQNGEAVDRRNEQRHKAHMEGDGSRSAKRRNTARAARDGNQGRHGTRCASFLAKTRTVEGVRYVTGF